ncbi:MAG: SDR family NAD(P)-dependent oxidoreductase [Acidobacteria bacterium]|nr:SDR family NAD(P)-dependent oxidoreductase [Acidobacteriota bacterium]
MKAKLILITGGAGFVGAHTADALIAAGHQVRIFDSLSSQVHRGGACYVPKDAEFILGDVRNLEKLRKAVEKAEVIFHLAAAVGVGQSMYEIAEYTSVNNLGTANLLQAILDTRSTPEKIVVASSMSIYGEGRYQCPKHGEVSPPPRPLAQLVEKKWEMLCPSCGESLTPVATREDKPLQATSVYALSKKDQEEITLLFGRTYQIPSLALRYFNIYGPRQSLSNPYTGVAAIFASRLLNRKAPLIFEDGRQMRDFVSVHDVVQANLRAMECSQADGQALNIGSGNPITIRQVADELGQQLGSRFPAEITGKYRAGDVRHCFADISAARSLLGYRPSVGFEQGFEELVGWLRSQSAKDDVDQAMAQLAVHGLVA